MPRAVLLVEGASDREALVALAARRGLDLTAAGVELVVMDGATNTARRLAEQLARPRSGGRIARLGGLYDLREERYVRGALERSGVPVGPGPDGLAAAGFFCCDADLEDELIRALGAAAVEQVLAEAGELASFRTMQQQPAQRGRPVEAQLHRFIGSGSGRKARYARLFVEALPPDAVPGPLDAVLAYAVGGPGLLREAPSGDGAGADPRTPEEFFAGSPLGLAAFRRVREVVTAAGQEAVVRVTRSQVAFWQRHGFAYLWRPGRYLRGPAAEVVLSLALPREIASPRFTQVVHPAARVWMHHLEIGSVDDVDAEVEAWLIEAADAARAPGT